MIIYIDKLMKKFKEFFYKYLYKIHISEYFLYKKVSIEDNDDLNKKRLVITELPLYLIEDGELIISISKHIVDKIKRIKLVSHLEQV